jgi:coenzyme F420 hydrogenase subunit beta
MCSHTVKYSGTELVLEKLGIMKEEVSEISYRGYGWPGGLRVITHSGEKIFIPLFGKWRSYWPVFSSFFFTPLRCIMCPDQTAELADLSTGDAWLPEMSDDKIGESVLITRSNYADELINQMKSRDEIELEKIDYKKIIESQKINLVFKKKDINARLKMLHKIGYKTPSYNGILKENSSILRIIRSLYALLNLSLSSNRIVRRILLYLPFPFFRAYFGIYKTLSSLERSV